MAPSRRDIQRYVSTHAKTALHHANSLSVMQRIFAAIFFALIIAFTLLFALYHTAIFGLLDSWKQELLDSRWKWLILASITAVTSCPPLIGYFTSVTLSGYVFGAFYGWLIAVFGTVVGAGTTFLVYRYYLSAYATRMATQNRHFMALTAALDGAQGMTLLTMIRFCPFPFGLSNAALATIPSVTFPRFMVATLAGTARLLIHCFVGSRLADLADNPEQDRKSRIVNSCGIVGGLVVGVVTGIVVYKRTKAIANKLASERGEQGANGFDNDQIFSDEEDNLSPTTSHENASLLPR